ITMKSMRLPIWISILVIIFFLSYGNAAISILNDVYYVKEPVDRLIFEFTLKPKFDIKKEIKKIHLIFYNVSPKKVDWIKKLPKDIFKEFDISYEKGNLILELTMHKDFNFQTSFYENKLFLDFLWESAAKPVMATIRGNETIKSPIDSLQMPSYEYPSAKFKEQVELPFTKKYTGMPISVDFQEADIHAVFRLLAEVGNINIVVSEKVKGSVTLKVKQVPWDQVLDIVLASQGLGMMKLENVIRIAPLDELKAESDKLKDYLTSIKDIQERGPLKMKTFQLKYVKGDVIVNKIKEIITGEGKITYETYSNTIIVKDTEKNIAEIEKIIKEIDKPTKQVIIEARIIEIEDNYAHKLGIRWAIGAAKQTEHTLIGSNATVDLGTVGTTTLGFIFGHFGKSIINLDVQLTALESKGVARIFGKPKILTLDNQDAEIKQGYKIPYLKLTPQGTVATDFIDAVLRLKVTPKVTPDNRINLDIEIEKSAPDWAHTVQGTPSLITRYAKTKVLISNGETLVIGGIKLDNVNEGLENVPGLASVPGVGEFFKKRDKTLGKTELMVFITPRIVSVEIPGVDY
ncbi:MAG: secretin N-terminal domain-containing protein, partial [Caldimicrobium sp.]